MAKEKINRFVVTLYTNDHSIFTSYWASDEDTAISACHASTPIHGP